MIIIWFLIQNKVKKVRFFEKTSLLADISMEVVLEMHLLILGNADIPFDQKSFTWRAYITFHALRTTRCVELINKHELINVTSNKNSETIIIYLVALKASPSAILVQSFWAALLAALQKDKASTKIAPEYANYADIFYASLAIEMLENTNINEHTIELIESKLLSY